MMPEFLECTGEKMPLFNRKCMKVFIKKLRFPLVISK